MIFLREVFQGFHIGQAFVFHHEVDGRTGLPASEAFVYPFCRGDVERRRLLVMERTARSIVGAASLQGDEVAYHIHNLCRIKYPVYSCLGNHAVLPRFCV